ncbi:hypothetical protein AN639_11225 [Candidatus Epulonipiscium fishelsonii]|uniref:Uncharacterized protein n=1 Tax=Candidatus Epulonipiscium fishelsonii TaxID=77094 RepID=A0ACC8X913_9FIRM|nr:hypothetical protein AN396_10325 [Epulopiscium sp. SCG-B11WGA-EpuloA1]ONI43161.1 hypothetical protein AN639_11225 [Epulopiscium sp. SCG-B05WGA-EpuloA1]
MQNSFFVSLAIMFFIELKDGFFGRIWSRIYEFVRNAWQKSFLNRLILEPKLILNIQQSKTYKVVYIPFQILNNLADIPAIRKSFIINFIGTKINPIYMLYLLVFIMPLLDTKIVMIVCGILIGVVICNRLVYKKVWKLDDIGFLILVLLIIYAISAICSASKLSSLMVWAVYALMMGMYIVTYQILDRKKIVFNIVKIFVMSGTLVSSYGILQYKFDWGVDENWIDPNMFENITNRAYSTLENPNLLGVYLVLTIMSGIGLLMAEKDMLIKIFYLACICIMVVCMGATYSRGCWIGIAISIAMFITFYNGKLWAIAIPVLFAAPFVLPENIIIRLLSIGNMEDTSTAIRIKIWLSSLRMGADHMFTGIGLGSGAYEFLYPFYSYYYIPALHSHNAFIQIFIEGGIIGLLMFWLIAWRFIKSCSKSFLSEDRSVSLFSLAILTGILGFYIQGMFDYPFFNFRIVLIFWMFLCFGTSFSRWSKT